MLDGLSVDDAAGAAVNPDDLGASTPLEGWAYDCAADAGRTCNRMVFGYGGRDYQLLFVFPLGFEASQELLRAYTGVVDRFRLAGPIASQANTPDPDVPGPPPTRAP
jgi:hypothetical protein